MNSKTNIGLKRENEKKPNIWYKMWFVHDSTLLFIGRDVVNHRHSFLIYSLDTLNFEYEFASFSLLVWREKTKKKRIFGIRC